MIAKSGRISGQIDCSRLSYAPNPQCSMRIYDQTGLYRITFGPWPSKNLPLVVEQLDRITEYFAERHQTEIPKYIPIKSIIYPPLYIDEDATILIKKITGEVQ